MNWLSSARFFQRAVLLTALTTCGGGGHASVGSGVDTTRPAVSAVEPTDAAVGVPLTEPIEVTFSEAIDIASVTNNSFTVTNADTGAVISGAVSASGRTARFKPFSTLTASTPYQATLTTAIKDVAGNTLASSFVWDFTTTTNAWTTTSTTSVPAVRQEHTAVWSDSEMIVWGGRDGGTLLNTGGRYTPSSGAGSWSATPVVATTPSGRTGHTAVWADTQMIVWGGDEAAGATNSGARFSPTANTWTTISTALSNTPTARSGHTAVWTGTEMIVWGGSGSLGTTNTGARYNPTGNTWTAIASSLANTPTARVGHSAIWTGSEMIIWGGVDNLGVTNTGARYRPSTNTWTSMTTSGAPSARSGHTAVWTGSEMIVWGGANNASSFNTGARYNPSNNTWTTITTTGAPVGRNAHTAIWTGSEMIVWGGNVVSTDTGGRYRLSTNSWSVPTSTNAPSVREEHSAVWTGTEMIIWGGDDGTLTNTGSRYAP